MKLLNLLTVVLASSVAASAFGQDNRTSSPAAATTSSAARDAIAAAISAGGSAAPGVIDAAIAAEASLTGWPADLEAQYGPRRRVRGLLLTLKAVPLVAEFGMSQADAQTVVQLATQALAEFGDGFPADAVEARYLLAAGGQYAAGERFEVTLERFQSAYALIDSARTEQRKATIERGLASTLQRSSLSRPQSEFVIRLFQSVLARQQSQYHPSYIHSNIAIAYGNLYWSERRQTDGDAAVEHAREALRSGGGLHANISLARQLLARANGAWGPDAEEALPLLEAARNATSPDADVGRYEWRQATALAIEALTLRDSPNRARAPALAETFIATWRQGDSEDGITNALALRMETARNARERQAALEAIMRAREPSARAALYDTLAEGALVRWYSSDGNRELDTAIELWRAGIAADPRGAMTMTYRLDLADGLWRRANGWDDYAREAFAIATEIRTGLSETGPQRAQWFTASDLALKAMMEGVGDRSRQEPALRLAEEIVDEWREGDSDQVLLSASGAAIGIYSMRHSGSLTVNQDRVIALVNDILAMPAAARFTAEERGQLEMVRDNIVNSRPSGARGRQTATANARITTCAEGINLVQTRWWPEVRRTGASLSSTEHENIRAAVSLCEAGIADLDYNELGQKTTLSILYFLLADFDSAAIPRGLETAERALVLAREAGIGAMEADISNMVTMFRSQMPDGSGAIVVADAEASLRAAQASGTDHQIVTAAMILVSAYAEAQNWDGVDRAAQIGLGAVSRTFGAGLNEREILEVQKPARRLFEIAALARVDAGDPAGALAYAERGRAQVLGAALGISEASLPVEQRNELQRLRGEIRAREQTNQGRQLSRADVDAVMSLRERAAAILSSAATRNVQQSGQGAPPVAVVTLVGDDSSSVIVRPARGATSAQRIAGDFERDELDTVASRWRDAYAAENYSLGIEQFRAGAEQNIGAAIRASLASAGVRPGARITLLPDGAMSLLPVALLRDPSTGRTLLEDYEVTFAPSLRALDSAERRAAQSRNQAPGIVAFWNNTLDYAAPESALATARFERATVMSPDAVTSPQVAIEALGEASYWHFAVHGVFDWENPQASALKLTSNVDLTLAQLLQSGELRGAPRLIVLSACESGLVDVERDPNEFIGLPAAFLEAGGAGVIASLWLVDDAATSLLFARFYELHRSDAGMSAPAALRAAQLWLRDASREELLAYVEAALGRSAIDDTQADAYLGLLNDEGIADTPYADPKFWGAWVYYGA